LRPVFDEDEGRDDPQKTEEMRRQPVAQCIHVSLSPDAIENARLSNSPENVEESERFR
jgi:hypothetical protein